MTRDMRALMGIVEGENPLSLLRKRLRTFDIEVLGQVPASTWLIHFSPHAAEIAKTGFRIGTPLDGDWHYTSSKRSNAPGYNFALPLDEYAVAEAASMDFIAPSAVLFRAAGLLTRHYDSFSQVIFWGPAAKPPFVVMTASDDPDDRDGEMHEWTWALDGFEGSFWDVVDHVTA